MYMHVTCLALYLPAFDTARSRTPIDFLQLRVCMRVCVKMMTSEVFGIDFR